MSDVLRRDRFLAAAVLLLILAAILRFHRIELQSFWNDEGNSVRLSERSLPLIIEGTASDIHPPLYYLVLRGWREFVGESEFAFRSLSAFLGIGIVALTIALGERLIGSLGKVPTLLAALLVTINPALVYYSQETRMYELLAFLALLSTLLLVMWMQSGGKRLEIAVAYILASTAGLYTHYFYPAVIATHNLIFILWLLARYRNPGATGLSQSRLVATLKIIGSWVLMMLAVLILYLPWLPAFWRQAGDRPPFRLPVLEFLFESTRWSAYGPTIGTSLAGWLLVAFLTLVILGVWFGRRLRRKGVLFSSTLSLSVIAPLIIMWILGATRPEFFKFILVVIPPLCLLAGSGWWWSWRWSTRRVPELPVPEADGSLVNQSPAGRKPYLTTLSRAFAVVLALLVLAGCGVALFNLYYDSAYARADYRGIVAQIAEEAHPNAGVVLNAANQWEVFTYYHQAGAPVYPLPRGQPDPAGIDGELNDIAGRHDRIYAVFWGAAERDPQRLVERWLDSHAFKARDEWRGDVRFVTYAVPADAEAMASIDSGDNLDLIFGEEIGLQGYRILSDRLTPGAILQLTLTWTSQRRLDRRFKVFLHLVDEEGQIVAQRDSEPGGGLAITTTWQPGELIPDNHGLLVPLETPPGRYTLLLGLYDFADPSSRLPISTIDGAIDAFPLASITVIGE